MKEKILNYINGKYKPNTIILYGSYKDGSNSKNSDFDALIITDEKHNFHDGTKIEGVELDLFIYSRENFKDKINYEEYIQIHDGDIILDKFKIGENLKEKVNEFIKNKPKKSKEEKEHDIYWCEKMLLRAKRKDTEGYLRWHLLLVESLEIYFDLCDEYYYGPKKGLMKLKSIDKIGFELYNDALIKLEIDNLEKWINYLKSKY